MQQLATEYRQVGRILFVIATVIVGLLYRQLLPTSSAPSWLPDWFLAVATSPAIYGLVYLGGLRAYERWGWARLHPELDCQGWWYFKAWRRTPDGNHEEVSSGTAYIKQTALVLRIGGHSRVSTYWQVRCIAFNDRLQGFFAYTGLPVDSHESCLDDMCGIGRFGPEYKVGSKASPPDKLVFVCQEMRRGRDGFDTLDIIYIRDPCGPWLPPSSPSASDAFPVNDNNPPSAQIRGIVQREPSPADEGIQIVQP